MDPLLQNGVAAVALHRGVTTIAGHPRCRLPARDIRERLDYYCKLIECAARIANLFRDTALNQGVSSRRALDLLFAKNGKGTPHPPSPHCCGPTAHPYYKGETFGAQRWL